jgi:Raf kinase inhibitor-like YbhB/YbcL family protein
MLLSATIKRRIFMAFRIFSSAFAEGGMIPELYTCDGADLAPSLEWNGEPPETRSFALIVEDPDAPVGTWCHWLLYDIPPKIHDLAQGYKPGKLGVSGANDFGKQGYGGPCPPKGAPHRYFFKLYALDVHTLGLSAGVKRAELQKAIQGHTLAQSEYLGRYQRK